MAEVGRDHGRIRQRREGRSLDVGALGGDRRHLRPGLRGADGVHDQQVRQRRQQAVPDRRRERCAAIGQGHQGGQVVVALLYLIDEGAGHRIADHRDAEYALALGQP